MLTFSWSPVEEKPMPTVLHTVHALNYKPSNIISKGSLSLKIMPFKLRPWQWGCFDTCMEKREKNIIINTTNPPM